jgi:hypothetical protein
MCFINEYLRNIRRALTGRETRDLLCSKEEIVKCSKTGQNFL